jgi:threonine dehydratase
MTSELSIFANWPCDYASVKIAGARRGAKEATMASAVDRRGNERVHALIGPYLRATPTVELSGAELGLESFPLFVKLEQLQHAGSFESRGAFSNLLSRELPAAGVVAASGGNHGAAVAFAARRLGARAKIFVPTTSSPARIERIAPTAPTSPW